MAMKLNKLVDKKIIADIQINALQTAHTTEALKLIAFVDNSQKPYYWHTNYPLLKIYIYLHTRHTAAAVKPLKNRIK